MGLAIIAGTLAMLMLYSTRSTFHRGETAGRFVIGAAGNFLKGHRMRYHPARYLAIIAGLLFAATAAHAADPLPAGKWLRPDGGYLLELSDIQPGGRLKAAYFNPRPIKVSKAAWRRVNAQIQVFIELRDVNYPGSTYTLTYSAECDRLEGIYYQAALKQTFDVVFVRSK